VAPGFTKTSERVIHQENWFAFLAVEFDGPAGERIERYVFRHPGAVGVVPVGAPWTISGVPRAGAMFGIY